MHPTPAGRQPGSLVHANYVEAILGERTYEPISESIAIAVEVLVVVGIAVIFALSISSISKLLVVIGVSVFLAAACLIGLQNLGLFFDFFIPIIVLSGHVLVDKVLEWRKAAKALERQRQVAVSAKLG